MSRNDFVAVLNGCKKFRIFSHFFVAQLPHLFQPAIILLPFQIPLDRWDLSLLYLLQLLDLIRPEATLVQLTVTTTLFPIKSISPEPILTVRLMSLLVFPLQFIIKWLDWSQLICRASRPTPFLPFSPISKSNLIQTDELLYVHFDSK